MRTSGLKRRICQLALTTQASGRAEEGPRLDPGRELLKQASLHQAGCQKAGQFWPSWRARDWASVNSHISRGSRRPALGCDWPVTEASSALWERPTLSNPGHAPDQKGGSSNRGGGRQDATGFSLRYFEPFKSELPVTSELQPGQNVLKVLPGRTQ